uniref:uncharacterized protein LOC117605330 n=1 Tax=Osmia lignaria TaxID=473952 RepID=UPI0014791F28|nr:uncharacterized protein LOC117605330 [Osmia lignaria]
MQETEDKVEEKTGAMTSDIISILSSEMLSKQFEVSTNACDWSSIMASFYLDQSDSSLKGALRGVWWSATVLFEASSVWHVSATDIFLILKRCHAIRCYDT